MHQITSLTFDDVLLVPSYNHWESRRLVDVSMQDKTGRFKLDLPIMTSNMDTITEHAMANFIAKKGGIGVLHRFMSIEKNVEEFKKCDDRTFVSIGTSEQDLERAEALRDAGVTHLAVGRTLPIAQVYPFLSPEEFSRDFEEPSKTLEELLLREAILLYEENRLRIYRLR